MRVSIVSKYCFLEPHQPQNCFTTKIKTAIQGVPGCVSIHDNILVWGTDAEDHEKNLEATLKRMEERNITARSSKSNFGMTSVTWFGSKFSATGMSADPEKNTVYHKSW